MRPIDADKLIAKYCAEGCGCSRDECGYTYAQNKYDCCQFVAEIDQAPTVEVQKWHSVEDELPELNVEVLGWYKDNPFSAYRRGVVSWNGKGWVFVYARRYVTNVTHWIELPKPPKEDKP